VSDDPRDLGDAMQRAAGVLAAKNRGDFVGAEALLDTFASDAECARAFCLLAELALGLVRSASGQSTDELVQELSLLIGAAFGEAG
jgi:Fe-Mn family superoxide dismutase